MDYMKKPRKKLKVSFNAPVILIFVLICFAALILNFVTMGMTNNLIFSVYRSSFANPLTYVRMICHVFGHVGWQHFIGNIMMILVVGPLLEEKYGSFNVAIVMFTTAVITGFLHFALFPNVQLLGASGIVFAFILMASITSLQEGKIPVTFILVAVIYIGGEVIDGIFVRNDISNLTHIVGGAIGAVLGFLLAKKKNPKEHII